MTQTVSPLSAKIFFGEDSEGTPQHKSHTLHECTQEMAPYSMEFVSINVNSSVHIIHGSVIRDKF